ncbi:MAG: zinc metallopeptidase [Clostridia bacterium]|nr:zinc metallopeptidase [Clostridia bacterium]
MFRYYYDPTYILVVLGALVALFAQMKVSSAYSRWSQVASRTGMTGAQIARQILDANGCSGVRVERVQGKLTDHYDPEGGVLRLSSEVYGSSSIAALGVAAHEAGHAIQDAQDYAPMRIRASLVPVANIGSKAAVPLFMLGLLVSWEPLLKIGILCFVFAVLFYVVTLPVELNASGRAVAVLSSGYLAEDEIRGVKAMLSAAALTYVAAALQAVLQLVRLVLIANSRRRDD